MTQATIARLYVGHNVDGKNEHTHSEIRSFTSDYLVGNNISDGATYQRGTGMWQGDHEETTIVEVMLFDDNGRPDIMALRQELEENFQQDAVMVSFEDAEVIV
jgi:hypothetical protein